ncbi:MAG: transposase [Pseudomonadota bacterium]
MNVGEVRRCRAFKYRLDPTVRQRRDLTDLLAISCEVYNAALQERRDAWRMGRHRVRRYDQTAQVPSLKDTRPDVVRFGVVPIRGALLRVDLAFQAFFRRCTAGEKPGYPRFKSRARWDSAEYLDQWSWKITESTNRLYLQGIGQIKARLHRPLRGTPKTCTVRREGRHWYVIVFCVDVPAEPLPPTVAMVGIDLGIASLVTTSDGEHIENPRHGRVAAERLAEAQRSLALKKRGSKRRRKAVERVAAAHRKVRNQRADHLHKLSRRLVNDHDLIVHEDLRIVNMVRSASGTIETPGTNVAAKAGLNRSIQDAGWAQLLRMIAYKAEEAGREVIAVDAAYTSQRCAECGHIAAANRVTQAKFRCVACGHSAHADVNAAVNILRAGLARRLAARSA